MGMNTPAYNTSNFSFGPGILYMGPVGTTPSIDVGAVQAGAALKVTRQLLQINQGSPQALAAQFAIKESVELSVTGLEWNLTNMARFLGAGVTASDATGQTLSFGGDMNVLHSALVYRHSTPAAHTIDIYLWDAQPSGEMNIQFQESAPHEFPVTFSANTSTTDFAGNTLPTIQQLYRIVRRITIAGWPRP